MKQLGIASYLAIGAVVAFAGAGAGQSSLPSSPAVPAGCPSVQLWQQGAPVSKFGTDIVRTVKCRPQHKVIEVEWRHTSQPLPTAAVPDTTLSSAKEVFATSYWPTYVQVIDNLHWCVAGKGRNGEVVIEYWIFGSATPLGAPAPTVSHYFIVGSTEPVYSWSLPPRVSVTEVQRIVSTSTGLVRALFRDPGSTQHVYVWYDTSRAFARLELSSGTLVTSAAPVAAAGVLGVPELSIGFDSVRSVDYAQKGYCFMFTQVSPDGGGTAPSILALIDSDRDGKVDSYSSITGPAWVADGWSDHSGILASY